MQAATQAVASGWLTTSPTCDLDDLRRLAREHTHRLLTVPGCPIETLTEPVFRRCGPEEAARLAGTSATWRWALTKAVGWAIDRLARRLMDDLGNWHAAKKAAVEQADAAWCEAYRATRAEAFTVARRAWCGAWAPAPRGRRRKAGRIPIQGAMDLVPGRLVAARIAATHAAFHHAASAVWNLAGCGPNPFAPLVAIWRSGCWPAGLDSEGRFLIVTVDPNW